jgi:hypothetical protein
VTDVEQKELESVIGALTTAADESAMGGHLRISGAILMARQTIRFLCTRLLPPPTAAPSDGAESVSGLMRTTDHEDAVAAADPGGGAEPAAGP